MKYFLLKYPLEKLFHGSLPKYYHQLRKVHLIGMICTLCCCTDFVEIDAPKNTLVSETVFQDAATVESALANLYYNLREGGMTSGTYGMTTVMGIYTDELDYYGFGADYLQFYQHNVLPINGIVSDWWSQAFQLIYATNDIVQGVRASTELSSMEKNRFEGEALFVRAYLYTLLVNLYGDVPLVQTTNYLDNNNVARSNQDSINNQIMEDLERSILLLNSMEPVSTEKIYPDEYTVKALLARHYLRSGNWERAVTISSELINLFPMESDLNKVFLKDSKETIWQLKADNDFPKNTREAQQLIIQAVPSQTYALSNDFMNAFEPGDQRLMNWTRSISDQDSTVTLYYPYKYKAGINALESFEYSVLFRSTEQVLIRSEAKARLGELEGALADVNLVRSRAGLSNLIAHSQEDVLEAILHERRMELFTEQGHRWLDLKRMEKAEEVLGDIKANWKNTDLLLPIPENELELNPNLLPQNPGY
ncbi:RagB/SusD family nutrient uptake outer membrane protein [Cytophaga sp. FL35]|uniref:RagB/SusD family nutrient uptake outer membrane protein n=1 Tax=Cytophaga sp. FL35 TaxID=1904456 RepID=UPI001653C93E|nr:RagB/SusD family nutrient uptake outer membrane protein [Cytophaga sp. FL35]MBC7000471.1 RagB/SusD family nutrient uptake outer membrane protein [Cytophaga sp. FL35]